MAAYLRADRWRPPLRILLSLVMLGMGLAHFVRPGPFVGMVPAALPAPSALVAVSGVCEMLLGAMLLAPRPRIRRLAGFGLVALFVAVFPANINMAVHPERFASVPPWVLWARLPLQPLLMLWALFASKAATTPSAARSASDETPRG